MRGAEAGGAAVADAVVPGGASGHLLVLADAPGVEGVEQLYPPMVPGLLGLLIFPAVLIAMLLWMFGARWLAMIRLWSWVPRPKAPASALPPRRERGLAELQREYLQRIEAIVAGHRDGSLSVRDAHLRFSAELRDFVFQQRGVEVRTMTLTELRAAGQDELAAAVAQFYPIAFAPEDAADLGAAPGVAREVISGWS